MILEEKMLITAIASGCITSIIGGITNLLLGYSFIASIIPWILALGLMVLFYFVRYQKKYSRIIFPFIISAFLGVGLIWINNGGYNGTNTIVLFTIFVLTLCILPTNRLHFIFIFFVVLLVILHLYQYHYPDRITNFPNEATRFADTLFTVINGSAFVYLMISFLVKNYRKERQIANERGDQLEKLYKEVKQLNEAKDKFFSIIAHDLKNPVANLFQISHLFDDEFDSMNEVERKEMIGMIKESSVSLLDLLNNLLFWSRSQRDKIIFTPELIDVNDIIIANLTLLKLSAANKNIKLDFRKNVNCECYCDKHLIDIVFRNLISNAIKFTNKGGTISIFSETAADEKFNLIKIKDCGVGIREEDIDKLFQLDSHVKTRGTNNEKGTGLGLILCKEFVELNGGNIWVESEVGKGSTFYFTIPKN
jgi:signal transduction histidine kinase